MQYFCCDSCGFVQTEHPYWLEAAYSEPIIRSDLGLVSRSLANADAASLFIRAFFRRQNARFLDYGGGTGLFVRLMRDPGFDFRWQDRFTKNSLAVGFEGQPGERYELATAFEVFEHLVDPASEVAEIFRLSDNILFSTLLLPTPRPSVHDWWYYALDGGQHVSIYTRESLSKLAARNGVHCYSNGYSLHLFSRRQLSSAAFRLLGSARLAGYLSPVTRRRSLLQQDYFQVTGKRLR